jgi:hypothetical protein
VRVANSVEWLHRILAPSRDTMTDPVESFLPHLAFGD